jgi:hypothetical protein
MGVHLVPAPIYTVEQWSALFWSRVHKSDGCWLWTAGGSRGYGHARVPVRLRHLMNGSTVTQAHGVAWVLERGQLPDGAFLCHHCDNPPCVRPDHMFIGTNADNMRDMCRKGRQPCGARIHTAKLTDDVVRAIRARHRIGERQAALAREYGLNDGTVSRLVRGRIWRHVS